MQHNRIVQSIIAAGIISLIAASAQAWPTAQASDPGVRQTNNGPPQPMPGLGPDEMDFFLDGLARFTFTELVSGGNSAKGTGNGLGPRFNSDQCSSCHLFPTIGGSSPPRNPLIAVASAGGATNEVPWFEAPNGPVREARFVQSNGVKDGGVHNLFVVTGRTDAGACNLTQPNFLPAGNPLTGQGGNRNIVFRIPTPTFGDGLIEAIPDSAILANAKANATPKTQAGVRGHANAILGGNTNLSANDGTITRFGWKAQNKSLLMFSGEAYNVEMGVSNQLFPQERDESPACRTFATTPEDTNNMPATNPSDSMGGAVGHRGLRQLHAHAGSSDAGAQHRLDGERPQSIRRRGLRSLPHAVLHHRPRRRQRLLDESEPRNVESAGQSILRSAGASHGPGPRRRHYPGRGGT